MPSSSTSRTWRAAISPCAGSNASTARTWSVPQTSASRAAGREKGRPQHRAASPKATGRAALVHLDLHLAGDLPPGVDLALEPGRRLLRRRIRRCLDELLLERILHGARLHGF